MRAVNRTMEQLDGGPWLQEGCGRIIGKKQVAGASKWVSREGYGSYGRRVEGVTGGWDETEEADGCG